jgi:hypothetical protein
MLKDPQPVDNGQQIKDQLALASIMGILDVWRSANNPLSFINPFQVLAKIRELVGVQPTPTNETTESVLHIAIPKELNVITAKALCDFCNALAEKLRKSELKYGYTDGWLTEDWQEEFHKALTHHLGKGDARDVAIYAMFAWVRGWQTKLELSAIPEWVEAQNLLEKQAEANLKLMQQVQKAQQDLANITGENESLSLALREERARNAKLNKRNAELEYQVIKLESSIDQLREGGSR